MGYLNGQKESQRHTFHSLRQWRSAAAPLGYDLTGLLEEKYDVPLESWYGVCQILSTRQTINFSTAMTETSAIVSIGDFMHIRN